MSRMFVWLVADSKFLFDTMLTNLTFLTESSSWTHPGPWQTLHHWLTIVNIFHNKPRKWWTISPLPPSSSLSSSSDHSLHKCARVKSPVHHPLTVRRHQVACINTGPAEEWRQSGCRARRNIVLVYGDTLIQPPRAHEHLYLPIRYFRASDSQVTALLWLF